MFVGHAFLAFALAGAIAHRCGLSRERALSVAVLAGLFGLAPDVDIAYAFVGIAGSAGLSGAVGGFWDASTVTHRTVTHSLLVGGAFALAAGALTTRLRAVQFGGVSALFAGVGVVYTVSGGLAATMATLFAIAVGALAVCGRRYGLSGAAVTGAAAVGLLSHPFGDLLTGEPPAFLYPFDVTLVAARPAVTSDQTLNLLAPLLLELSTFWLALVVAVWILDGIDTSLTGLLTRLRGRATLAVAFGLFALVAPAPSLHNAYLFVFSLLGVGIAVAVPLPALDVASIREVRGEWFATAVTGLTAVTLATLAYAAAYLAV